MEKVKTLKKTGVKISKETYLSWYQIMLRIRRFEEKAQQAYMQQKIRGFLHLYIGQEAIAAGAVSATKIEDPIITAYRDHGIALARGMSSTSAMAELYGKSTGCSKGKGGSMHLFSKEHNFFGGHAIVGAQIPMGAGIAFAEKYRSSNNVCLTFMGDGAVRGGAFHETFNLAMMWKLPVVFICENNFYSMGTSVERSSNVTDIYKLAASYDMPGSPVDGMDPEKVHLAILDAVQYVKKGNGPTFLEMRTYRYKGHSMSDPAKYRSKQEVEEYKAQDPIELLKNKMLKKEIITQSQIEDIAADVKKEMENAVKFAEESPFPDPEEIFNDVYSQSDYPYIRD